ncbi:MAG TPA: undecaprenyl-phosphate galactose phosphotransferase WbaP [Alphaproteobacteria bacterium]|nr:undecaprenyl-phosphate galactose phosphotransferase WbaP [Alphaproteobacteria bacterium]
MSPHESIAKKLKEAQGAPQVQTSMSGAEKRINVLLREIENVEHAPAANKDTPFDLPHAPNNEPLRYADNHLRPFIITDAVALILGFVCAWWFAATVNAIFFDRHALDAVTTSDTVMPAVQFLLLSGGILFWFGHTGHYQIRMPFWMETKKIVETICFAMLIGCFLEFVSKHNFSRLWLTSCWAFSVVGIIALRSLWRGVLRHVDAWDIPTLVVGDGATAEKARAVLKADKALGYRVVAQIKDLTAALQGAGHSWKKLCEAYEAGYVVIALDGEAFNNARQALAQLMREHIAFSVAPPMHNLSVVGMMPQCFLGHDIMLLARNSGLEQPLPRILKRTFDLFFATLGLIVLSPFLLLVAALIKLDGGDAFYRHRRIGLNGKVFSCLKFRSMVVNSDAVLSKYLDANPVAKAEWLRDHKLRKDPRTTRIGRLLRRTSMDELPQLFNVLSGSMSIVGPRPIIVAETEKYDSDIAFYYRVRPGITGLWQISGRNDVSYAERVRMDSWYVRNWSLWHDITIICKTFNVVLKQRGAY